MRIPLLFLALTASCSIAFQSKPPAVAGRDADCSASRVLPVVDLAGMAASVAAGAAGMIFGGGTDGGNALAGGGLIVGILYLASGANGWKDATRCREMRDAASAVATE